MPSQTLNDLSLRFFPHWNDQYIYQTVGLINMVDYIFSVNPNAGNWLEIGSYIGESATIFLSFEKLQHLCCLDHSKERRPILDKKFKEEVQRNRCSIVTDKSENYVTSVEDEMLDVIYIDADHSYESISNEIKLYWPKVKQGGFLCGHDYHETVWPGVFKAVNEFTQEKNMTAKIFKDCSWLVHKE